MTQGNKDKFLTVDGAAYIANGCCVVEDYENNEVIVIYLPKRENGSWIAYGPDGVKPAPSFSYRIFF